MNGPHPIRLLLVDSHALTRAALGCLLTHWNGQSVVSEAATLEEAVTQAGTASPDIVLLHLRHQGGPGVDAISPLLMAAGPATRLLIVTEIADADVHRRAVRLGASGIVSTERPAETLFKAIEKVRQGEVWMERRLVADLIGPSQPHANGDQARIGSLTPREREVVGLLCEGLRNKQIADRLTVTDVTVRHHLTSVFSKLGVSDRLGLLLYASKHGMTPPHTFVSPEAARLPDAGAPNDH